MGRSEEKPATIKYSLNSRTASVRKRQRCHIKENGCRGSLELQGKAVSCHPPPRAFHQMDIFLSALKYSCCLKQLFQGPTPDSSNYIQVTAD